MSNKTRFLAKLFGAKREVTESDAKRLMNLASWKLNEKMKTMLIDNWFVWTFGAITWFALGFLAGKTL